METYGLADILGPVMVGPSSSHTAGALRIARMTRSLLATEPVRATFTLYGSFACTHGGHGTDKALVAGLLGLNADDLRIRESFKLAQEAGLSFSFVADAKTEVKHPNTVDLYVEDEMGTKLEVRGESVGGGASVIRRIDGVDVAITGERTNLVVSQHDEAGVLAHIAGCLADCKINIATTSMYRTRRGSAAYTIMEVDDPVPAEAKKAIERHAGIRSVRVVPAMLFGNGKVSDTPLTASELDHAEQAFSACDFTCALELLERCSEQTASLGAVFLAREEALGSLGTTADNPQRYLERVLSVMRASAFEAVSKPSISMGGLIGGEAAKVRNLRERKEGVLDTLSGLASEYALAVLETNASMGCIVAAPTAGSSGVLPGVLLALQQSKNLDDETLHRGLLAAAAIGYLIARNATVAGAEGGCQAEVGSAAAMAAAAAVEMMGGSPSQALNAASNALTSLMGLVCDPIGGLVEVPCQKRNATAATIALVSAQIALAGVNNLVNFDETVAAMDAVGRSLPFELRESALGGIAAAPSACAWCNARNCTN